MTSTTTRGLGGLDARDIEKSILNGTHTAVVCGEMPRDELPAWLAGVLSTVRDYLRGVGVPRTGPPFARYTFLGDTVRVEAGFPVARYISGDGLVEPSTLPADLPDQPVLGSGSRALAHRHRRAVPVRTGRRAAHRRLTRGRGGYLR
jgi:hypothetical protein